MNKLSIKLKKIQSSMVADRFLNMCDTRIYTKIECINFIPFINYLSSDVQAEEDYRNLKLKNPMWFKTDVR